MQRHTLQVGSYGVNCSLLETSAGTLIVDPGQEAERIVAALAARGLVPAAILLTHGHYDHINAVPALLAKWPDLPVVVSDADAAVMAHPLNACPPEYGPVRLPCPGTPPEKVAEKFGFVPIATPGHTPGGVCYHFPEAKLLLSGDTLFAGSVGRTDLPGGDMATLMASLEKLRVLPPETVVVPGHGPFTTIAAELAGNPFLQ